jgi:hypothetical protein
VWLAKRGWKYSKYRIDHYFPEDTSVTGMGDLSHERRVRISLNFEGPGKPHRI